MHGTRLALACLLTSACAPAVASRVASVNGAVDTEGNWPGVVVMQIRKPEGIATCTGVLIAPNLLLTARHCVSSTQPALVCGASPLAPPVGGDDVLSTNDLVLADTSPVVRTVRVEVPPEGNDECGFDIAAVILAGEFEGAEIYPPRLDRDVTTGETFTAVGYGTTGSGGLGTRRVLGEVSVACVGGVDCTIPEVQETEWVATDGAFCRSDSGAPAIDADGNVIGVISKGINPCSTPILSSTYAFRDWIRAVGVMAAEEGDYPSPAWAIEAPDAGLADAGTDAPPESDAGTMSSSGGCAVAGRAARGGGLTFLLSMLALAARRRRSSRSE